jgi:integrase
MSHGRAKPAQSQIPSCAQALLDQTPHVGISSSLAIGQAIRVTNVKKIKIALKRIGEGSYVPHGLRATAAVRLIEAGCSEDQAAAITGHRDLNVLRGYLREVNQAKLARQAIRKQEAAS